MPAVDPPRDRLRAEEAAIRNHNKTQKANEELLAFLRNPKAPERVIRAFVAQVLNEGEVTVRETAITAKLMYPHVFQLKVTVSRYKRIRFWPRKANFCLEIEPWAGCAWKNVSHHRDIPGWPLSRLRRMSAEYQAEVTEGNRQKQLKWAARAAESARAQQTAAAKGMHLPEVKKALESFERTQGALSEPPSSRGQLSEPIE